MNDEDIKRTLDAIRKLVADMYDALNVFFWALIVIAIGVWMPYIIKVWEWL